jgi:hypothetical protein
MVAGSRMFAIWLGGSIDLSIGLGFRLTYWQGEVGAGIEGWRTFKTKEHGVNPYSFASYNPH